MNLESYAFDEISWPQHESICGDDLICSAWAGSCHGLEASLHWIRSSTKHNMFLIEFIRASFFPLDKLPKSSIRMRWANSLSRRPWVHCLGTSLNIEMSSFMVSSKIGHFLKVEIVFELFWAKARNKVYTFVLGLVYTQNYSTLSVLEFNWIYVWVQLCSEKATIAVTSTALANFR